MVVYVKSRSQGSQKGHTRAKAPLISIDQPGRLRVCHLLAILGISHSTFYSGLKSGRYPKPDGRDLNTPYWNTSTVRGYLNAGDQNG